MGLLDDIEDQSLMIVLEHLSKEASKRVIEKADEHAHACKAEEKSVRSATQSQTRAALYDEVSNLFRSAWL